MKTQRNQPTDNNPYVWNGINGFRQAMNTATLAYRYGLENRTAANAYPEPELRRYSLLTEEAAAETAAGRIPDLETVCNDLYHTFLLHDAPWTALQFVPVLNKLTGLDPLDAERFLENPKTNHVLVRHALLKVVLIHWKPGSISSIHGHPKGGCVFRVLQGSLVEKRYSPDDTQRLLAVGTYREGSMAYIDDSMAYHAVANPFNTPAISLHVYTPGGK